MFSTRVHGLGGQGTPLTAELLAAAARRQGLRALSHRQGRERAGAPVTAWCRIGPQALASRSPADGPDALVVEDPSLVRAAGVVSGLGPEGYLLVNSASGLGELGCAELMSRMCLDRVLMLPATRIAVLRAGRPRPGPALLGGLCALTGAVSMEHLAGALIERFGSEQGTAYVAAARAGHAFVAAEREALSAV